ncbi:glycosyl hydrolase [Methylomonas rhizoryzae]|uniref:glycosyl hydrolase n=1 Tax=Methylomonas rhizoryzae TaxID=2608981 RepID=UPI001E5CFE8E|nr:hypothetical protein [Methylomonas rhizoryzae]
MIYLEKQFMIVMVLIIVQGIRVVNAQEWKVNSWGAVAPEYDYNPIDPACSLLSDDSTSTVGLTSFKLLSRGNGDAELVIPSVLKANKGYNFRAWIKSSSPTQIELLFRKDSAPYEAFASRIISISNWQILELNGINTTGDNGSVRLALKDINVSICMNSASVKEIPLAQIGIDQINQSSIYKIENDFFGLHINKLGTHNIWPSFNPGTLRLWDTGTTWALMQPQQAPINWTENSNARRLDYYIKYGKNNNYNVQFVYTLGMTPIWAGAISPTRCNSSPYGTSSCTMPIDPDYWRNYIQTVGNRYKGIIKVWEVWNEADVKKHWESSSANMLELVKIAYQELKAIDPENQIIGPNVTTYGYRFLSAFIAAGGGDFVDGFSIHSYTGRNPLVSYWQLKNLREMLNEAGLSQKDIWNTETNSGCSGGATCNILSSESALAQGLVLNAAMGVKNYSYYTYEGSKTTTNNPPLVESDFSSLTTTGVVYDTLKKWMLNSYLKVIQSGEKGFVLIQVDKNGNRGYITWATQSSVSLELNDFINVKNKWISSEKNGELLNSSVISLTDIPVLLYPDGF